MVFNVTGISTCVRSRSGGLACCGVLVRVDAHRLRAAIHRGLREIVRRESLEAHTDSVPCVCTSTRRIRRGAGSVIYLGDIAACAVQVHHTEVLAVDRAQGVDDVPGIVGRVQEAVHMRGVARKMDDGPDRFRPIGSAKRHHGDGRVGGPGGNLDIGIHFAGMGDLRAVFHDEPAVEGHLFGQARARSSQHRLPHAVRLGNRVGRLVGDELLVFGVRLGNKRAKTGPPEWVWVAERKQCLPGMPQGPRQMSSGAGGHLGRDFDGVTAPWRCTFCRRQPRRHTVWIVVNPQREPPLKEAGDFLSQQGRDAPRGKSGFHQGSFLLRVRGWQPRPAVNHTRGDYKQAPR